MLEATDQSLEGDISRCSTQLHKWRPIPALGVLIFALGGLAGAVFYLPFKKVKNWAWESYWLVYAVFGLVVVPWALALGTSPNVLAVLEACAGARNSATASSAGPCGASAG